MIFTCAKPAGIPNVRRQTNEMDERISGRILCTKQHIPFTRNIMWNMTQ